MILSDLGARVIKVEAPEVGDTAYDPDAEKKSLEIRDERSK